MTGPCLLDLEKLTKSDTATMSFVITGKGIGGLAGNIVCGNVTIVDFVCKILKCILVVIL